jgi:serine phosphatase RsbU (regulator of sigma subunit)
MSIESVKNVIYEYVGEKPDFILEKLRKIAISRFSVNIDETREDSMDAAICLYDKLNDKFYYSGGFINLYIVRNKELIEVASTKCPVGPYPVEISYELNEMNLEKGDVVYLASDGFADQFGYQSKSLSRPTKFKRKRFKELIKNISHLPTDEQADILNKSLNDWRGDLEQIDDVTMFVARH